MQFLNILKSHSVKIALIFLIIIIILSILAYTTKDKISGDLIQILK